MNGTFVPYEDAKIHVLSHVVHYGSSVFEGNSGLRPHRPARRSSAWTGTCSACSIPARSPGSRVPYGYDDLMEAIRETVRKNGGAACYIRPVVYRGFKSLGVNPTGVPIDVAIATLNWGKYLGKDALDHGISVRVASWNRQAPNTFPAMAKTGANYLNSQLIKLEAVADGYEEGIA